MSLWGYQPFQCDFALDMRDEVVFKYAVELESGLRDTVGSDLEETHIYLTAASFLYAITRHCGNGTFNRSDVERWHNNAKALLKRIEDSGADPEEDVQECRSSLLGTIKKLDRYVGENDMNFLRRYEASKRSQQA